MTKEILRCVIDCKHGDGDQSLPDMPPIPAKVAAHRFSCCESESRILLSALEAGERPDLGVSSRSFGSAIEFAICDLLSQDETLGRYWVDGVIMDAVTLRQCRTVEVHGTCWCAQRREQWQVPVEIVCRFANDQASTLLSIVIRMGNAAVSSLADDRKQNINKLRTPQNWLLEFEVTA